MARSNPDAPAWGYALKLDETLYMPWTMFVVKEEGRPLLGRYFVPVMTRITFEYAIGVY